MSDGLWVFIIAYLFFQLGLGYWVSRYVSNESDYFLAGRKLGVFFASISMFATWFGAETCMGSSGAIFSEGLGGSRADPFGYTICLLLFGLLIAGQLRAMKLTTLGDFYGVRYSRMVEKVAVLIMIPTSLMWAAAQVRAFGQILSVVSPLDPVWGVTIAAIFVIAYTFMGGLMGDVATDVVQGGVLVVGLFILLVACIATLGGWWPALSSIDAQQLSFVKSGESLWQRLDTWMVPILGSLVAQEMISRTLATKSPDVSRRSSYVAAVLYLAVGMMPVLIGLLGPHILGGLDHSDQFLPTIAGKLLSPALYVLFMGALISAILSTVDSTMLTISAFVTHNLMGKVYLAQSEKRKLFTSRMMVVVAGVVSYIMALSADGIYGLVQESSAFGSAGVVIVTLMGIWWRDRGDEFTAAVTLGLGVLCTVLFKYIMPVDAPFIFALLISGSFYVISCFARGRVEIRSEATAR